MALCIEELKGLTFQQKRILSEQEADLKLWGGPELEDFFPAEYDPGSKREASAVFSSVLEKINRIRKEPTDYSDFIPYRDAGKSRPSVVADFRAPETIMGRCPCPDESNFLRCCSLKTLDAVQRCGFACSYCSIQSFYSGNRINVVSDLAEKLANLDVPADTWHIGTGQSSDSLLLGDEYGTLTALAGFAAAHPDIILELKTKSARTDWMGKTEFENGNAEQSTGAGKPVRTVLPANIICSWSLNAATIAEKEELLTAPPAARIKAAAKAAGLGMPVGFHIHPMVYFKGWQDEYRELVRMLCDNIDPDKTVMVSLGTLTFTKANLRTLREAGRPTRVTCMELTPVAGKFSYPFEVKRSLFSYVYRQFPQDWREKVFFYLCMEDPALWEPCLGRSYDTNAAFEADMKNRYFEKINKISGYNFR